MVTQQFGCRADFDLWALEWDGGSRCPGGRRRRGIRARWPLSVTVIAGTGTSKAVIGTVTVVTAVTGGLPRSPRADSPGYFRLNR